MSRNLFLRVLQAVAILGLAAACDLVPKEAVEISNTVGRDLEEVHRAHRELALLQYARIEQDIDRFIDETYRPDYIKTFAKEFDLPGKVQIILNNDPDKLLPVLTRFVEISTRDIEAKRQELLLPIRAQRDELVEEIDAAHRNIQAAQAVITGHLASVRQVREVQTEILGKVGLGDLREKVAGKTAEVSGKVADLVDKGSKLSGQIDDAAQRIKDLDSKIDAFVSSF